MRSCLLLICFLCVKSIYFTQTNSLKFKSVKEFNKYAFSNSDLNSFDYNFLIDRILDFNSERLAFFEKDKNATKEFNSKNLMEYLKLLQLSDFNNEFVVDSILFDFFTQYFSANELNDLKIPFFISNMTINKIKEEVIGDFDLNIIPYREMSNQDLRQVELAVASTLLDTFYLDYTKLEFSSRYYTSNNGSEIESVKIASTKNEFQIYSDTLINVRDLLSIGNNTLNYRIYFSDGNMLNFKQEIFVIQSLNEKVELCGTCFTETYDAVFGYTPNTVHYIDEPNLDSPQLRFLTIPACSDSKVRKPFILVSGWGTHTDKKLINNSQDWPTSPIDLLNQYNQEDLLNSLKEDGFDIILASFYPPNASVAKNAELLSWLINHINETKVANESFEENIIMGFSAGSLATRYTLLKMEYEHLNQNKAHHHTKLYISNDGEQQGANIPLGLQHAVEYLWDFEHNFYNFKIYALRYILNAPLSKELLAYFHTATGDNGAPTQGPDYMRTQYLADQSTYNHSLSTTKLNYPNFMRMISISNGSSTPSYSGNTCNHYPYPSEMGATFFKQNNSLYLTTKRKFVASFLAPNVNHVFKYERKPLFGSWEIGYEAITNNPRILDNAPGGIIFIEKNPMVNVVDELKSELTGAPDIANDLLFSFTPTVFTHDIMDGYTTPSGFFNFNFKEHQLMNQNEFNIDPSNFFGYPHLGSQNHYSITPFDALFAWDKNTEHLLGDEKHASEYIGVPSIMETVLRDFVLEESEADSIFLQNKKIGFYTRPSYTYRVDYKAKDTIFFGEHVTQKTDFSPLEVEPNAVVEAKAGKGIVIKSGTHIKSGASFHAFVVEPEFCEGQMKIGLNATNLTQHVSTDDFLNEAMKISLEELSESVLMYPNPSQNSMSFLCSSISEQEILNITVFDMSGQMLSSVFVKNKDEVKHQLKKGVYIVQIKTDALCVTKRLLVQ